MSINDTIKFQENRETNRETPAQEGPMDVMNEHIVFQILHGLGRIEHKVARIERRLSGVSGRGEAAEKPRIRPMLTAKLLEGWVSEAEIIEKTGWQTIGVRSFITKLRGLGFSVETEDRAGVPYYRIGR